MSMKLYELTESYKNIWELVGDEEIDIESLEAALQSVEAEIETKAENIVKMMKSIQAETEAIKEEEKRLSARRKAMENKSDRIKFYIEEQLKSVGIDKVKTPLFTVAIQNNPPSVEITDESLIPSEFVEVITVCNISKKAILEKLKAGDEVPGAVIKQTKSLRIR